MTAENLKLLDNKVGIIMGAANERSISWQIANACLQHGVKNIILTFQSERLEKKLKSLASQFDNVDLFLCDLTKPEDIDACKKFIEHKYNKIDFIVHGVAFSDKNELAGDYINTSLDNFINTMHISCYSFTEVLQKFRPIINPGGSALTLSYYGAEKFIPNYNVMGVAKAALECSVKYLAYDLGKDNHIRVNAISSGPIKTLAASGINDFNYVLKWNEHNSAINSPLLAKNVAKSAVYLLSDLSTQVTAEIHHVDCGYNASGMINIRNLDNIKEIF